VIAIAVTAHQIANETFSAPSP